MYLEPNPDLHSGARSAKRLDTTQTTLHPSPSSKAQARSKRREKRYWLRDNLREVTTRKRLRSCGRKVIRQSGVTVRLSNGVAGFAGLETCGSGAVCPVCGAKISARRAEEVADVLKNAQKQGYSIAMATFTLRHRKGQKAERLFEVLTYAWSRVTSGKKWASAKKAHDIGFIRAVEVTHGKNGWHPHIHALLIFKGEKQDADRFTSEMWERWESAVNAKGFTAEKSKGFDVSYIDGSDTEKVAGYLAKQTASEAVFGQFKEGKKGSRSPFQIASDFFETGDSQDLELWEEWEEVSAGRKFLTYSKGLRDQFGQLREMSDDEIASQEVGSAMDDLVLLTSEVWSVAREFGTYQILAVTEKEGKSGLIRWLDERGLPWMEPPSQL